MFCPVNVLVDLNSLGPRINAAFYTFSHMHGSVTVNMFRVSAESGIVFSKFPHLS